MLLKGLGNPQEVGTIVCEPNIAGDMVCLNPALTIGTGTQGGRSSLPAQSPARERYCAYKSESELGYTAHKNSRVSLVWYEVGC